MKPDRQISSSSKTERPDKTVKKNKENKADKSKKHTKPKVQKAEPTSVNDLLKTTEKHFISIQSHLLITRRRIWTTLHQPYCSLLKIF